MWSSKTAILKLWPVTTAIDLDNGLLACYAGDMTPPFLTITEAIQVTGKSRRTVLRLAHHLFKNQPDQVMREKTARGYIWRICEQSLPKADKSPQPDPDRSVASPQDPALLQTLAVQQEKYLEVAHQGYAGMLAMHQEVKQVYEVRLAEKEQRIAELTAALTQVRRGWWARIFGF